MGIIGKLPEFNHIVNNINSNNPISIDTSFDKFTSIMREIVMRVTPI